MFAWHTKGLCSLTQLLSVSLCWNNIEINRTKARLYKQEPAKCRLKHIL